MIVKKFEKNSIIFSENDVIDRMFFIKSGSVEISTKNTKNR